MKGMCGGIERRLAGSDPLHWRDTYRSTETGSESSDMEADGIRHDLSID